MHAAIDDKKVVEADRKGDTSKSTPFFPLTAFPHTTIEAREHHKAIKMCDFNITKSYQFMKGHGFSINLLSFPYLRTDSM